RAPRTGRPGRKGCSLVATIMEGGTHIDHADMLSGGDAARVAVPGSCPFHVRHVPERTHVRSRLRARQGHPMRRKRLRLPARWAWTHTFRKALDPLRARCVPELTAAR